MAPDQGYWIWVLRRYTYLREKGRSACSKRKADLLVLAPKGRLACRVRIRVLGTHLLDPEISKVLKYPTGYQHKSNDMLTLVRMLNKQFHWICLFSWRRKLFSKVSFCLMSFCLRSFCLMSFCLMSFCLMSFCLMSFCLMSFCLMSFCLMSFCLMSFCLLSFCFFGTYYSD